MFTPRLRWKIDCSGLARFGVDDRGVAAVEFALIAPLMIAIYLGLSEICLAYMAQKRAAHTTSQVADIVAQTESLTKEQIADVFAIGALVLKPFPTRTLGLRVTAVTRGTDGVAKVVWSQGKNMGPRTGVVVVPNGIIANGESVIMSETSYRYESQFAQYLPATRDFTSTYFLRPRLVDQVRCSNC